MVYSKINNFKIGIKKNKRMKTYQVAHLPKFFFTFFFFLLSTSFRYHRRWNECRNRSSVFLYDNVTRMLNHFQLFITFIVFG